MLFKRELCYYILNLKTNWFFVYVFRDCLLKRIVKDIIKNNFFYTTNNFIFLYTTLQDYGRNLSNKRTVLNYFFFKKKAVKIEQGLFGLENCKNILNIFM